MHHVFDLWVQRWRRTAARGDIIIVRYLDDFIVGFEIRKDAEQFLKALRERLGRFGLTLHPRQDAPAGIRTVRRPEPAGARERKAGHLPVPWLHPQLWTDWERRSSGCIGTRRVISCSAMLREVKTELLWRRHDPVPEVGKWLGSVVIPVALAAGGTYLASPDPTGRPDLPPGPGRSVPTSRRPRLVPCHVLVRGTRY
jgi:hypothetical protein